MEFDFKDETVVTVVTLAPQAASQRHNMSQPSLPRPEIDGEARRATQAASNRERMPQLAGFVDHLRSLFGQVTVRWASENGFEVGERGPQGVPVTPPQVVLEKRGKR